MFSDQDIRIAIENFTANKGQSGILIEPLEYKYLTPVGYDLRVGEEGFSWNKKSIIKIKDEGKITIGPNDTVVIKTLESITLSNIVSATIHSIVSNIVYHGLSDISTTVDPGWTGKLLITVHNNRDISTELMFKDPLCTICFYKVENPAQANRTTQSDRDDLWKQLLHIAKQESDRIQQEKKVEEIRTQQEKKAEEIRIRNENKRRNNWTIAIVTIVIVLGVILSIIYPTTTGSSIAAFLAVIAPMVYDKYLKNISKP